MNKLKENRIASFIVILIVYALAGASGIFSYRYLPFSWEINLFIADAIATVVVFIFSLIFKNASVYDPYWSVQPIFIVSCYFITSEFSIPGLLALIAITIWGVRLTANWAYCFGDLTHQDWRYTMLHEQTKKFYPIINFVGIHMVPTIIVYACVLPACYLIKNSTEANILTYIFFACALLSVLLQCVSDIQMQKYRKNRTTPFIRVGVWKNSRHPNYLAEILMWWSIGLLSVLSLSENYILLIGAFLNTCLFLFVSIPLAEKRQSRKEGFIEYKNETRMLLPIKKFKKKNLS
jgi:steroid 5-alpha reductase family enzyme